MHPARTALFPERLSVRLRSCPPGRAHGPEGASPLSGPPAATPRTGACGRGGAPVAPSWPGVAGGVLVLVALTSALAAPAGAQTFPGAGSWTVAAGDVQVRCRLTVGGSFDAATSSLSGVLRPSASDAAAFSGELRVDLATLDTGIDLRNRHLRDDYLEVERGPDFRQAVLSGIVLGEPPPAGGGRSRTRFSGFLALHGVRRAIEGEAELRRRGRRIQVEAVFRLSLEAFGIPPPRYLGIGVRDAVEVTVRFDAAGVETPPDGRS